LILLQGNSTLGEDPMEDLQQKQLHRDDRIQQAVSPQGVAPMAFSLDTTLFP